eukprot:3150671-Alexandrium_andersonii.AAC.1
MQQCASRDGCVHGRVTFAEVKRSESWKRPVCVNEQGELRQLSRATSHLVKQARRAAFVADAVRIAKSSDPS